MSQAALLLLFPSHILERDVLWTLAVSLLWSTAIASLASVSNGASDGIPKIASTIAERILMGTASVSGLLLAFRSNSATTRWNSGAKAIATVQATSRSLLRILSTSLLPVLDESAQQHVEEYLSLIPCFSLALLHQLEGRRLRLSGRQSAHLGRRGSTPPVDDPVLLSALLPDKILHPVTAHNKSRRSPTAPPTGDAKLARKPEYIREYNLSQNIDGHADLTARGRPLKDTDGHIYPSNLALDILRELQIGLNDLHRGVNGDEWGLEPAFKDTTPPEASPSPSAHPHIALSGPLFAHSIGLLNTLSMQLTDLERLRDLAIPAILSSHLHMLLNLQLILTPLALLPHLGPQNAALLPIPCVVLTAATFGLHSLAERLAQPFGTSREKLPMRRWCADILREWRECVGLAEDEVLAGSSED